MNFSYTVEEVNSLKEFKPELKVLKATKEIQYEFVLENQKKPPEPPKPNNPPEVNVKVTKSWIDETGKALTEGIPKDVSVKLVRKDSNGGRYDLETIKLNAGNNWSYIFSKLPSKGVIDGKDVDFSYTIVEVDIPKGFKANIKTVDSTDGVQYEFILKNQKKPPEPPKPPKPNNPPEPSNPPKPPTPDTGDNDSATLYFLVIMISLISIKCFRIKRNRNRIY